MWDLYLKEERCLRWISDWFKKADKNGDGRMNFKEVRDLLKMMNVDMNDHHALRLFTMADNSQSGTLEDDEFVLFYKMLTQREEVLRIFQSYSSDGQTLSLRDLEEFLRAGQLEQERVQEHATELIQHYEPSDADGRGLGPAYLTDQPQRRRASCPAGLLYTPGSLPAQPVEDCNPNTHGCECIGHACYLPQVSPDCDWI
ncbi:hypothetical protein NFI96_004744 [Prochilodus magdalenae]|nr:hypothetical protein NFI96_004744 [Prochilodus magdalenae]